MWTVDLAGLLRFPLIDYHGAVVTPMQLVVAAITLGGDLLPVARGRASSRICRTSSRGRATRWARLSQYAIWALGIAAALKQLDTDLTTITVVAGALGIGVGFGLQNIVDNFVAGFVLLFERPIKVGDRVTTESVEGNVVAINLRSTTIVTNDNIAIIVPNTEFISRTVINWSHGDPRVRIHVPVGVAYGIRPERGDARRSLGVARDCQGVLRDPRADGALQGLRRSSSLNFELLVWLDEPAMRYQLQSRSELRDRRGVPRAGHLDPVPAARRARDPARRPSLRRADFASGQAPGRAGSDPAEDEQQQRRDRGDDEELERPVAAERDAAQALARSAIDPRRLAGQGTVGHVGRPP